ncbi:MAG TPA: Ig-like domain-containing protein, partial [Gammaproteobacteria bacterium]|nr:Ig-like domain-containing protein [Gammaproteobacteria bacterium]
DAIIVKIPAQLLTGASGGATPPTVAITNPTPGATLSGTVSVTADASDPAGIANVQFLLDGTNLGSALTQAPYSISWNTSNVAAGTYTLTAMATDNSGLSSQSSPVTVTIPASSAPPPSPPPPGSTPKQGGGSVGLIALLLLGLAFSLEFGRRKFGTSIKAKAGN